MFPKWADSAPIYRQLANALAEAISDGSLAEGALLPPVRTLATRYLVNPSVVARALMGLPAAHLIELTDDLRPRVPAGAQGQARTSERERFVNDDWPKLRADLVHLGLGPDDLP
jgi:GntR family transcriptional regulator